MFESIKLYANAIIAVCLLVGLTYTHLKAYDAGKDVIQAKFDSYKENINEQVQKAKDAAEKTKLEQDSKYAEAQIDYANINARLDAALERLRKPKTMPRGTGVQVAGTGTGTMPTDTENTSRTPDSTSFGAGTFRSAEDFYEAALKDTAQCKELIEFVR